LYVLLSHFILLVTTKEVAITFVLSFDYIRKNMSAVFLVALTAHHTLANIMLWHIV